MRNSSKTSRDSSVKFSNLSGGTRRAWKTKGIVQSHLVKSVFIQSRLFYVRRRQQVISQLASERSQLEVIETKITSMSSSMSLVPETLGGADKFSQSNRETPVDEDDDDSGSEGTNCELEVGYFSFQSSAISKRAKNISLYYKGQFEKA